jgi:hypothetical protein
MLQLALWSTLALSSQARLLADAPLAEAPQAPAPTLTPGNEVSAPKPELHIGYHLGAGAAAAVVFVPTSLYLAEFFAHTSNNYIVAAIPMLLCLGLIPPIAVTVATVLAGNWKSPKRYRWWPAFLATLLINGISLPIASALGLSVGVASTVIIYTLVQAVVLPGAAVLIEREWPRSQPVELTVADPIAPRTFMVPASTWSF